MAGQIHRLKSLLHALALYAEARGRLVQIEAREAAGKTVGALVLGVVLGACIFGAWLLAAPALVWLVAKAGGWPWTHVALAAAGLHLGLAVAVLLLLKSRLKSLRAFEETFNQFQRDREWLSHNADSD